MKIDKININNAIAQLNTSRTTLYKYLKKAGIKPKKSGNRSYITNTEIAVLKRLLPDTQTPINTEGEHPEQEKQSQAIEKIYQEQIHTLKNSLSDSEIENKKLIFEMGKLQGIAQSLRDQNEKLQKITIEQLQTPKIYDKISFWQRCQNIWK
jgi:transcriptional regulator of acetoin/glycerol metabolism